MALNATSTHEITTTPQPIRALATIGNGTYTIQNSGPGEEIHFAQTANVVANPDALKAEEGHFLPRGLDGEIDITGTIQHYFWVKQGTSLLSITPQ